MAGTMADLDAMIKKIVDGIGSVKTLVVDTRVKVEGEVKLMEDAFSRFLAKLAAGSPPVPAVDVQPEIDALNAGLANLSGISSDLNDISAKLDNASAEASVEGV